jgi:hypothetical protein
MCCVFCGVVLCSNTNNPDFEHHLSLSFTAAALSANPTLHFDVQDMEAVVSMDATKGGVLIGWAPVTLQELAALGSAAASNKEKSVAIVNTANAATREVLEKQSPSAVMLLSSAPPPTAKDAVGTRHD